MRQALSTVLHYIQVGQYIHTASYTVAAFEWLITIDLEILHVWNSPWTVTKVVFLINRYLPIVDFCLGYSVKHATHIDTCRTLTKAFTWIYIIGVYVADYILAIRTCAVWGFNKILIAVLVLAQAGSFFFNVYYFNVDITVKGLIRIPPLDGCFLVQPEGHGIFIEFTILAVYDTAMLILMIYPTIKEYSRQRQIGEKTLVSGSEIVASIIAEGAVFYAYLMFLSIATLIIVLEVPDNVLLFLLPSRVIREVLACRVLLHIRQLTDSRSQSATMQAGTTSVVSELFFA